VRHGLEGLQLIGKTLGGAFNMPTWLPFDEEDHQVTGESEGSVDGFQPEKFLAELEGHIREIEAAGGRAPEALRQQLERMKRMLAEGPREGIRFMQAADGGGGFMGFSVPLDPADRPRDSEGGAP
jgi:hypothetical protein